MIVVAVSLAVWIGVVWWQDNRTLQIQFVHQDTKVSEEKDIHTIEEHTGKDSKA